jgi:hypothetical protein
MAYVLMAGGAFRTTPRAAPPNHYSVARETDNPRSGSKLIKVATDLVPLLRRSGVIT